MSCLNNILGIKATCAPEETPLSGQYITDYPGITIQSAASINDEKTVTGYNYLVDLRRRSMQRLNNDLLSYINTNYKTSSFITNSFKSGEYTIPYVALSAGTTGQRRGMVVTSLKTWCRMYKIVINKVRVYSNETIETTLNIVDTYGGVTYSPTIALEAGVVTEFIVNKTINGSEAIVTIPSDISVYSNKPDCGCGGRPRNEYLRFDGINNGAVNTAQAYGIELDVTLKCDISTLICDMATDGIIGQAAYELCGAMFYDEAVKNHRINYLTIYKGEELKEQAAAGFAAYNNYIERALSGLTNYLANTDGNCGCVNCGGVQIKSNI